MGCSATRVQASDVAVPRFGPRPHSPLGSVLHKEMHSPCTPTKPWLQEDSPLGQYRVAIRASGRHHSDCQYRTIDESGRIEKLWHCGHPTHGTIDDGQKVQGREVEFDGEVYLDLGVGEVPTGPQVFPGEQVTQVRKLLPMKFLHKVEEVGDSRLPPYWKNCGRQEDFREHIGADAPDVALIQKMLDETWKATSTRDRDGHLPDGARVHSVQRVENSSLWRQYQSEQNRLEKKWPNGCTFVDDAKTSCAIEGSHFAHRLAPDTNELYCFHGTSPSSARSIAVEGFQLAKVGSHKGAAFGQGFYFAESSSKADEYSHDEEDGLFAMILCRIVCGEMFRIEKKRTVEVKKALASGLFDSVLADREEAVGTYREFVVFTPAAAYPEFVVLYKRGENAKPRVLKL
mmetsp:Transcript_39590/g.126924  ORF Transcript_39590/g.126924 Transcript_39590/m.126924 type:complete len:401 (+) Transcript_39590:90-1292(+)|eukprot:CAMPEP_0203950100 /NCGR_PEP_ID=MMETSP0359-20131031/84331_1 /ASSEMBLY_ACC=CAM_ASM_000338 /TAXON_ID=268821 /ORGANISM="Scrippsiella Hangoei, Strain SHTV-5" /LENGTH=400 /DNA_ID=CAMNT_0050882217 /DNA_START=89 /DNA_END=1291 /DNA_ORIENTATION=-